MQKIKIIVVDDHQMFLDGIIAVLSSQVNMEVLFVENSAIKALKKIKNNLPDIVITDVSMPEMNGLQFVKILKNDYPEIKILVLSMFEYLQNYNDIDGFLLKETDKEELINTINKIVLSGEKHFANVPLKKNILVSKNKNILSKTEIKVLKLISEEYTTEEISKLMFVSKSTIESHRKNLFFKLDVKNIAGLVRMGVYLGVIH